MSSAVRLHRQMRHPDAGFTLTELAVVMTIVGLLLASAMFTLTAQMEMRNRNETERRLQEARELLLGFAITNRRLPCPATCTNPPSCSTGSAGDEDPAGGGACTTNFGGFLPAKAIGMQGANANGFAVDAWGNPIRYAVSTAVNDPGASCPATGAAATAPGFTNATNLQANGLGCLPDNVVVCRSATGVTGTTCGTATSVTNQNVVVAVVFATGKNTTTNCATCTDEAANTNGDGVFVYHEPSPADAPGGEYDDQMVWIPVTLLYGRLVSAGVLP